MRTLILPDVHQQTAAVDAFIARIPADQIVFLGDYFDRFGDSPEEAAETAWWLRRSLEMPGRIHLFGNHDLPYAFPDHPDTSCPGWTPGKHHAIAEVLHAPHWEQFRLAHAIGSLVCSHAGISRAVFEHPVLGMDAAHILRMADRALTHLRAGLPDPVFAWSPVPDDGRSGLTWLRWWEMEVYPDFSQVVGHTPGDLRIVRGAGRCNVCLDTMGKWVGLVEDGAFTAIHTVTGQERTLGSVHPD